MHILNLMNCDMGEYIVGHQISWYNLRLLRDIPNEKRINNRITEI